MHLQTILLTAGLVFVWCFNPNDAYSYGAPSRSCSSLRPPHGSDQAGRRNSPVALETSTTSYRAGDSITVIARGSMRGTIITARRQGMGSGSFGTFSSSSQLKTLCLNSALTHRDDSNKRDVVMTWTAPQDAFGYIYFVATISESKSTWWSNVRSNAITGPAAPPGVTTQAPVTEVAPPERPQNSDESSEESEEDSHNELEHEETEENEMENEEIEKENGENEHPENEETEEVDGGEEVDKENENPENEATTQGNGQGNQDELSGGVNSLKLDSPSSAGNRKYISGSIIASGIVLILSTTLKLFISFTF